MPINTHPLLKRQLKKYLPENQRVDSLDFIEAINETYLSNDMERKLLERSLEISSQELMQKSSLMTTIFEAFPDIFLRINLEGKILDYKTASINISKILPEQLIGRNVQEIFALQMNTLLQGALERIRGMSELITFEHATTYNNKKIYFEARIKSLLKDQAIIIIRDITERKIAEDQLKFDALHDRLTLLPNRALLIDRIESFILRKKRNPKFNFAVVFIDFDRFKLINDSLGHMAGDELLVEITKRLTKGIRGVDTLARLGGDEFCIVLDDVKTESDTIVVADRLQKLTSAPYFINNKEIFMTLSAGIVISEDNDVRCADDYIRESDIAMYAAKKNGRAKYVIFNAEMKQQAMQALDLEGDFRRAIENNEFQLYYQPIISLSTKEVLRMEALVRWIHPTKGVVAPDEFIPFAEESGLIFPLGEFVMRRACEECREWQQQGFPRIGVAVNFSPLQFHHSNIAELIQNILGETGLNPADLEVEITESVAMKNIYYTINMLKALKDMKVKVVIDDFGAGYSSLGSLSEFSIDALKIDRKFIHHIPGKKQNMCLTTAIIGLAHNLGLKVVGEGIENQAQFDFLLENQCDEGQGFFLYKPMPSAAILKLIKP